MADLDSNLFCRDDLTEKDISEWLKFINTEKPHTVDEYQKNGIKVREEMKYGIKLYYTDTPYGKFYIDGILEEN